MHINNMDVFEAANFYHRLGFPPVPLKFRTKTPMVKWKEFQYHLPSEKMIKEWFSKKVNIAIVTGSVSNNLVVVDIDAPEFLDKIKKDHPQLLKTPLVRSDRGFHLYYYTEKVLPSQAFSWGDLLSAGHFGIVPPSVHPSGTKYQVINNLSFDNILTVDSLPFLPEKEPTKPTDKKPTNFSKSKPKPKSCNKSSGWITQLLQGVSKGNRNVSGARLAGYLHSKELPADIIYNLLRCWNLKNSPPLDEKELRIISNSICRKPS